MIFNTILLITTLATLYYLRKIILELVFFRQTEIAYGALFNIKVQLTIALWIIVEIYFIVQLNLLGCIYALLGTYFFILYCLVDPDMPSVGNLSGKVVLITGGTSGIGYESAKVLARAGADVVITGSGRGTKGEEALAQLNKEVSGDRIRYFAMNQEDLDTVDEFVEVFKSHYDRLDILIMNSGYGAHVPNESSVQGFEKGFAVMHLHHFLLFDRLKSMLLESEGRVVTVASSAHLLISSGDTMFDDISPENPKMPKGVKGSYARAKLSNILLATQIAELYPTLQAFSLHPGAIYTPIWKYKSESMYHKIKLFIMSTFLRDPVRGAADIINCATNQNIKNLSGTYFMNQTPTTHNLFKSEPARNKNLAAKLWKISEDALKSYLH
eukprot:TRINITY_DN9401_c0_g1_i1.p1 TRINITY_DN9401_c0_g1~~TRINITY_DN9401_c0_g1_i1.p1  ORF type:complete len:394 (-),score=70.89 TRINITY_DN9401_c0_g1_i1:103-1254(-)